MSKQPSKHKGPISQELTQSQYIAYLLSFLLILVIRAGGELTIENLKELGGTQASLGFDLDIANDRVVLKVKDQGIQRGRGI